MTDEQHFYHTTEAENLDDIRAQGLKPFRPSHRGEQDAWPAEGPDGKNTEPRVYLANTASQTTKFQASGNQRLLRVKRELLKDHPVFKERYTGDFFTRKRIKPEHLEVQETNEWKPLKDRIQKSLPPHIQVEELYDETFDDPDIPGGGGAERSFRITHPKHPYPVRLDLIRHNAHPEGHWEVQDMFAESGDGVGEWSAQHANHIGPADMRKIARHLRDEHGIRSLAGERITGVRRGKVDQVRGVNVEIRKSEDPIVAPAFRIVGGDNDAGKPYSQFSLEVMHPDGKQGAVLHLGRESHYPPGHWHLFDVEPIDHTRSIEGAPYSRNFANRLGPAVMRHTVNELKRLGVRSVHGFRVTGSRFPGHTEEGAVEGKHVEVAFKSLVPHIREMYNDTEQDPPGWHFIGVEVTHPETQHSVEIHLSHNPNRAERHWHIDDIVPSYSRGSSPHARKFSNQFGPGIMRHVSQHLKEHYGIDKVIGYRITGARHGGRVEPNKPVPVEVTLKSIGDAPDLNRRGRGDALQPYAMKKRTNAKLGEVDLDIRVTAPGPMRRKYNAPVSIVKAFALLKARVASLATLSGGIHSLGERQGLSRGAFRSDPADGSLWYVKRQGDQFTYGEHLVNQVYRALGHHAPHSMILHTKRGKPIYLSKHVPGFTTLTKEGADPNEPFWQRMHPHVSRQFLHGAAADALVGNNDLHGRNVGLVAGKTPMRIDNGSNALSLVDEWSGPVHHVWPSTYASFPMRDAADIHKVDIDSPDFLRPHVERITHMVDSHGGWQSFVNKHIPSAPDHLRTLFADTLAQRHKALIRHVSGSPIAESEGLPGVAMKQDISKSIDYDALEDEFEPRPKKGGKGGKGSPVGSRTAQARHQLPAFNRAKARIAALKPDGVAEKEWAEGVKHEAEHKNVAPSKVDQAKIAAAHLKEEPRYYSKLKAAGVN